MQDRRVEKLQIVQTIRQPRPNRHRGHQTVALFCCHLHAICLPMLPPSPISCVPGFSTLRIVLGDLDQGRYLRPFVRRSGGSTCSISICKLLCAPLWEDPVSLDLDHANQPLHTSLADGLPPV